MNTPKKRRASDGEVHNNREALKLADMVRTFVIAHGGRENSGFGYPLTLPTHYGPLQVAVHVAEGLVRGNAWSVFGRFDKPPVGLSDVNPYSGKWNLHLSGSRVTAAQTFDAWKRMVTPILTGVTDPRHRMKKKRGPRVYLSKTVTRAERRGVSVASLRHRMKKKRGPRVYLSKTVTRAERRGVSVASLRRRTRKDPRRVVDQGFDVNRVYLDKNGYDRQGRYFGSGANLYTVTSRDTNKSVTVRAASVKTAKAEVLAKGTWKLYSRTRRAHQKWGAWR